MANQKAQYEAAAQRQQQQLTKVTNHLSEAQGFLFAQHQLEQARKAEMKKSVDEKFQEICRSIPGFNDGDAKAFEMLTELEGMFAKEETSLTSCLSASMKGRAADFFARAFLVVFPKDSFDS